MTTLKTTGRLAALALAALPGLTFAAEEKAHQGSPLARHEKLQERLKDATVRLLDARPRAEYDQGHIPGALWVDVKAIQDLTKPESIKDEAAWAKTLAPLGISDDTKLVFIYDGARQHDAARVWWALSYAGVPRVGLVDGGFALWQREHRPVSTESPEVSPREFRPKFRNDRLSARATVQKAVEKGEAQVIDARSAEEYRGEKKPQNAKLPAGHIPSAHNLDGYSIVDADGRFLDKDTLKKKLGEAGISAERPVIAYSVSGARSSIVVFALEKLGVPVSHYSAGLTDWSQDAQAKVIKGGETVKAGNE